MTHTAETRVAPEAPREPVGTRFFEQRLRELEEALARLENATRIELDNLYFRVAEASLDSRTTQVRTGTRDGEWSEVRG
jgi:hypothetical protein